MGIVNDMSHLKCTKINAYIMQNILYIYKYSFFVSYLI